MDGLASCSAFAVDCAASFFFFCPSFCDLYFAPNRFNCIQKATYCRRGALVLNFVSNLSTISVFQGF